ncbi:hypothetical protein K3495_g858 [Podosphaera aphanis]|nr:hypothetical protein K3495_g858 [Podosphaera aphanis]
MKKIQDFLKEFDLEEKGIANAWQTLRTYAAKLEISDESLKNTCPEKFLFLILTKMLSKEYMSLLDRFRLQPDSTIQEKVDILEDKERDIKGSEYAHPAIDKNRKYKERRSSDITMPDIPNEMLCYKCDGDDHLYREFPFANGIKSFVVAFWEKFERRKLKQRHSKPPAKKNHVKSDKKKPKNYKRVPKSKKTHGYTAHEDSDSSSDTSSDDYFKEYTESGPNSPRWKK